MATEFTLSVETVSGLENFSAKLEVMRNTIDLLHALIWGGIMEGEEAVEQAGALVEMLLEVADIRNQEIDELITSINPVALPDLVNTHAGED